MAPQVRALAQSESKAKFMARLGLDDRKDEHKQLYTMMKVGSILSLTGANFTSLICFAGRENH
jgi:hypothetical protein